jgi:uncharacterized protein DUF4410
MILKKTRALMAALVAASLLAGCASGVKRADTAKTSAFQPSAEFPIGQVVVSATPEVREHLKDYPLYDGTRLRAAIEQELRANSMLAAAQGSGLVLEVVINHLRIRSKFNAVMWGPMAGGDSVDGEVTIKDASGKVLDKFSVSTSYALGGFAGGADSRIDWLNEAFAKQLVGQFMPAAAPASTAKKR